MSKRDWVISATPPTPNGDLHVGHMSGPYLAADIFRRARMRLGDTTAYICYGDDHQSYVLTTATRRGLSPTTLMETGNADIAATLDAYQIGMDAYSRPGESHKAAVSSAIQALFNAGLIVEKACEVLLDQETGAELYESFAEGRCPQCLLATKGGICESCGHPNDPIDLLDREGRRLGSIRRTALRRRLVLPIEDYRADIIAYYADKRGQWRPHILHLVDELLSQPLADYTISHPSTWGVPIGLPDWGGHVVNVWAEMGLGLLHALSQHKSVDEIRDADYVQFLGYDNSYFFAIVHPVLQFALHRAGLADKKVADFIFTNEFYHLDNRKFSTSKGHALWGRALLEHLSSDEARFYLSLHGPELSESNFVLQDAVEFVSKDFTAPLAIVQRQLTRIAGRGLSRPVRREAQVRRLEERARFFSEPEHFSSRELSKLTLNTLQLLASMTVDIDDEVSVRNFVDLAKFMNSLLAIVCPKKAAEIQNAFTDATFSSEEAGESA